jgi:hypothetical protein
MEYKILGAIVFALFIAVIMWSIKHDSESDADAKVTDKPKDIPGKESQ